MTDTPNLALTLLEGAQSQKHVTVNAALARLDAGAQLAVQTRSLTVPPTDPANGARYLVAAGASDAWAGEEGHIAAWSAAALGWTFLHPRAGWRLWVADETAFLVFDGSAWRAVGGDGSSPQVGVNTSADTTNRLAVKSDAVLLSHDDVTPGTGDHRIVVNKAAAARTAAFLFQTGYSGRAEFGLTGDDDFHLKVSADGASFSEAMVVSAATGQVAFDSLPLAGGSPLASDARLAAIDPTLRIVAGVLQRRIATITVTDAGQPLRAMGVASAVWEEEGGAAGVTTEIFTSTRAGRVTLWVPLDDIGAGVDLNLSISPQKVSGVRLASGPNTPVIALAALANDALQLVFPARDLPETLRDLRLSNTAAEVLGPLVDLPGTIEKIELATTNSALTGALFELPATTKILRVSSTPSAITGSLGDLPSGIEELVLSGTNSSITGGGPAPAALRNIVVSSVVTTVADVDSVLASVVAGGGLNGTLKLTGTCPPPSAAGLADVATLESRGWSVQHS